MNRRFAAALAGAVLAGLSAGARQPAQPAAPPAATTPPPGNDRLYRNDVTHRSMGYPHLPMTSYFLGAANVSSRSGR